MAKSYFKQNYCHTCHTRFAVIFPLLFTVTASILFFSFFFLLFSFSILHSFLHCFSLVFIAREFVTPLFAVPVFSSSTCRLVWVGATHKVVMVTFQAHLRHLSVFPCTFPTPIYCRWVNVAKYNLDSGLHH